MKQRESDGWRLAFLMLCAFMVGFSTAMALVGESPWSDFWLRMARGVL